MEDGGGGDPDDQEGAVRLKGVREGHVLFFGIMDEVELDDADLPGSIHQFNKKAVVHALISSKMNLSI